jgi:hypothetical protein
MSVEIKAPTPFQKEIKNNTSIFLAGSIEMGTAEQWQKRVVDYLEFEDVVILNPRRDDWDSSWKQTIQNKQFREQVLWEHSGLVFADVIAMYFAADSKSPITLLELGMFANSDKLVIFCPKDFYRRGNIEVVASIYGIPLFDNEREWLKAVKQKIHEV